MANVAVVVVLLVLLSFLGVVVRFSIVSAWRSKGARLRLRQVDAAGAAAVVGFRVPEEVVELYRSAPFLTETEFRLIDLSSIPPKEWYIGGFFPLTPVDLREQRRVFGLTDGIPIADDLSKGVYFVASDGRVVFRSPNNTRGDVVVARTARDLAAFAARMDESEE
jgi:hypothetical protein